MESLDPESLLSIFGASRPVQTTSYQYISELYSYYYPPAPPVAYVATAPTVASDEPMSKTDGASPTDANESIHEEYVLGVRIVELTTDSGETVYRFEADTDCGREFEDPALASLYADIYFCTNGFEEEGTGDRGVPPEVIGAGRAVLASYFLTQPSIDQHWVASFFGVKPHRVREYTEWVRENAAQIRDGVAAREME